MKEDKSLLWSMSHHLEAAMALINMGLDNDLLDVEMLEEFINSKRKSADTIWEEKMWQQYADIMYRRRKSGNVYAFDPELRGPAS